MKKIAILIILAALIVCLFACNGKKTRPETALSKYNMELQIADNLETVGMKQTLSFTNNTGIELNEIKLRLYPDSYKADSKSCAFFTKLAKYGGITMSGVSVGGAAASYEAKETVLTVALPSPLPAGDKTEIYMESTLDVPKSDLRLGLSNGVLKLCNFYPVLCVYQSGGWRTDPFYKVGNPFVSDCADYEVKVVCNKDLVIASSGAIISDIPSTNGTKTVSITGASLRDFAIAASKNFKVIEGIQGDSTVKYYYIGEEKRENELAAARSSLEAFGEVMGAYPYPVFSIVEADFYYNSASFGNLAVISKTSSDKEEQIIHETAHQWFGNIVGSDNVNDCWQNEALASFLCNYYYLLKGDKGAYGGLREADKNEYVSYQSSQQKTNASGRFNIERTVYNFATNYEYGMISMKKGSLMFDAVFQVIGKEKMNKALKSYFEQYAYRTASTSEMLDAFDKASRQDVTGIVRSWLDEKTIIAGLYTYTDNSES